MAKAKKSAKNVAPKKKAKARLAGELTNVKKSRAAKASGRKVRGGVKKSAAKKSKSGGGRAG